MLGEEFRYRYPSRLDIGFVLVSILSYGIGFSLLILSLIVRGTLLNRSSLGGLLLIILHTTILRKVWLQRQEVFYFDDDSLIRTTKKSVFRYNLNSFKKIEFRDTDIVFHFEADSSFSIKKSIENYEEFKERIQKVVSLK